MLKLSARYICPLILMMTPSLPVWALCCPGDIKDPMFAGSSIGQAQPPATDVSLDGQRTLDHLDVPIPSIYVTYALQSASHNSALNGE